MAIVVNTNVASLNAQRNLTGSGKLLNQSLQRLSSGLRINSAKDDAAGLAISDRMNAQVRGLNQAVRNANDGISMAQTAEGAMNEMTNIIQRMRELAVQSRNSTNTANDRESLDAEFQQLNAELDRIATTTAFNGRKVLDGSIGDSVFQVGANVGETISVSMASSMRTNAIGSYAKVDYQLTNYLDQTAAETAAYKLDVAGDLTINSTNIAAATAGTYGRGAGSAYSIANAINLSTDTHGVTAEANASSLTVTAAQISNYIITDDATTNDTLTYTLSLNDVQILTQAEGAAAYDVNGLANLINGQKDTTGVTAAVQANGDMVLSAADGRNIEIKEVFADTTDAGDVITGYFGNGVSGATVGPTTKYDITKGSISLTSRSAIVVGEAAANTIVDGIASGATATTNPATIDASDILTESAADLAIYRLDEAVKNIDDFRGDLGAIQNRFESTIANLMNVSENISAAKSRIVDADFAAETASLTKSQILQQAGLAMLSQANQVPQAALTLLQG
jgi:flagellin